MITEIEIEETVKRVVKCDPGYRFLSDEEWARGACDYVEKLVDGEWVDLRIKSGFIDERHRYRIKLTPQPFEWKGVMYEEVFDPEYVTRPGDLYTNRYRKYEWKYVVGTKGVKVGELLSTDAKVARPIKPLSYEGEVSAMYGPYATVNLGTVPLSPGDRVQITKLGEKS